MPSSTAIVTAAPGGLCPTISHLGGPCTTTSSSGGTTAPGRRSTTPSAAQVRRQAGRDPTPSAGSIDSQTVKATEIGGPHGYDGGKKLNGRKRHIVVDTLGLLLAVTVTAASADDGTAAPQVLAKLTEESFPRLKKLWADNKYRNHSLDEWMSEHGWYVIEITSRPPGSEGFRVIKWRWVVERTFAWLGRCRIHSRDYERKTGVERGPGADQHDPVDAAATRRREAQGPISLSQTGS